MPGGSRARSGAAELGSLLALPAFLPGDWHCCTAATVLGDTHSHAAPCAMHSSSALPEQELKGHSRCTAASQKGVLEHFSDSPFKRLRSLGTELKTQKTVFQLLFTSLTGF